MKKIIIKTQEEFDKIKRVEADEIVETEINVMLKHDIIVYGQLVIVSAYGNSRVSASDNSRVSAYDNSTVSAYGNSTVSAFDNSRVTASGNSRVTAYGNSTVSAFDNSRVTAFGNSRVSAYDNSRVSAYDNSTVSAFGNSRVSAFGQVIIRNYSSSTVITMQGFCSLIMDVSIKMLAKIKKDKTSIIQRYKQLPYLKREGINAKKGKVVLFKKVSKEFKTQEGTPNETLWRIGSTIEHPSWAPEKEECGPGKFHACSKPFFCDGFRELKGDRYIAIEICIKDLYEWKDNPEFPHKIGFRAGKVLYECDKYGNKLK